MAKKGLSYHCPNKRVQIPADVRALQSAGLPIAQAIRTYWDKIKADQLKRNTT